MISRLFFGLRYWLGNAPWDTGITPPELVELVESGLSPGRALDLGCGTGTNCIYLAKHGWQVTGVDFVPKAIHHARRKAKAAATQVEFRVGDVTGLSDLTPPFHLALDIGCFHSLTRAGHKAYVQNLANLLAPDGLALLYIFIKEPQQSGGLVPGLRREEVSELFDPSFRCLKEEQGKGRPSAWYTFQRTNG